MDPSHEVSTLMRDLCTERLVSVDPLVVRRRVSWGECDPAGVVYTPRFAEYFVSASDWFKVAALAIFDRPGPATLGIAFPLRALDFDFQSFLAADDIFDMTVRVSAITRHTFTLNVLAHGEGQRVIFKATGTHICLDRARQTRSALTDEVRRDLEHHRIVEELGPVHKSSQTSP